jgi:hypothetical protein
MMNKPIEQIIIEGMSNLRYEFIRKYEDNWDESKGDYNIKEPEQIDKLSEDILNHIKKGKYSLPFEFIIE